MEYSYWNVKKDDINGILHNMLSSEIAEMLFHECILKVNLEDFLFKRITAAPVMWHIKGRQNV